MHKNWNELHSITSLFVRSVDRSFAPLVVCLLFFFIGLGGHTFALNDTRHDESVCVCLRHSLSGSCTPTRTQCFKYISYNFRFFAKRAPHTAMSQGERGASSAKLLQSDYINYYIRKKLISGSNIKRVVRTLNACAHTTRLCAVCLVSQR